MQQEELGSDEATRRDLETLDILIAHGVHVKSPDWAIFLRVADKVIDEILNRRMQLELRQFMAELEPFAKDPESPGVDGLELTVLYLPGKQVELALKSDLCTRQIGFNLGYRRAPQYLSPKQ